MDRMLLPSLLSLLSFVSVISDKILSPMEPRVIGGTVVNSSAYPYQAALAEWIQPLDKSGYFAHFCGGSIISKRWILTAAHCIHQKIDASNSYITPREPSTLRVVVGRNNISYSDQFRTNHSYFLEVEKVIINDDYQKGFIDYNDIGLLKLKQKLFCKFWGAKPALLPTNETKILEHSIACVAGFGYTYPNDTKNVKLNALCGFISNHEQCNTLVQGRNDGTRVCLDNINKNTSVLCDGDSGSGLVRATDEGRFILLGVASFVMGNCEAGFTFFTRVAAYLDWIYTYVDDIPAG